MAWRNQVARHRTRFGRRGVTLLAAIAVIAAMSARAEADFRLCNATPSRIGVAIGYEDPKGWATEGWWTLASNSCETLLKGKLPSRFYYIHAVDYDRGGAWSGPSKMCIRDKSFIIRSVDQCEKRGATQTGFFEVDTGSAKHWTVRLADPKGAAQKSR